jgi:hypothetical protein
VHVYEWAVLRVVPRVERCEFVNAGVVVYCKVLEFLQVEVAFDRARALALDPHLDVAAVEGHLAAARDACAGAPVKGERGQSERFRWLTAPRSTVVQPSPIHAGLTEDPARELARLVEQMVLPPGPLPPGAAGR